MNQGVVDLSLVFKGHDLVLALLSLHVDLVLLCPDEGPLVHVGVDFNVGVIAQLQSVLFHRGEVDLSYTYFASLSPSYRIEQTVTYPFAVINWHFRVLASSSWTLLNVVDSS